MELMHRILVTKKTVSRWRARHPGEAWCIAGEFVRVSDRWIVIREVDWTPAPVHTGKDAYIALRLRQELAEGFVRQGVRPGHVIEIWPDNRPEHMIANFSNALPPEVSDDLAYELTSEADGTEKNAG